MLVVRKKLPEVRSKIHNHRFGDLTFEKLNFYRNFETVRSVFWNLRMILSDFFLWKFILNVSNDWKWITNMFEIIKRKSSVPTPDLTSSQQVMELENGNWETFHFERIITLEHMKPYYLYSPLLPFLTNEEGLRPPSIVRASALARRAPSALRNRGRRTAPRPRNLTLT